MTDREELRKLAERGQLVRCVHWINTGGHSHVPINPSVLGLLDQLDAAESKLAAVRELHSPAWWYDEFCDDPSCEQEHVEIDVGDLYHARPSWLVCECCSGGDLSETHEPVQWPCPTIRALGGHAGAPGDSA
jgi:hypothetical protein